MEIEEVQKSFRDQFAEAPREQRQEKCLEVIARLKIQRRAIERLVEHWVREARDQGVTWQAIGDALGITHQAARQRFGTIVRTSGEADALEPTS